METNDYFAWSAVGARFKRYFAASAVSICSMFPADDDDADDAFQLTDELAARSALSCRSHQIGESEREAATTTHDSSLATSATHRACTLCCKNGFVIVCVCDTNVSQPNFSQSLQSTESKPKLLLSTFHTRASNLESQLLCQRRTRRESERAIGTLY